LAGADRILTITRILTNLAAMSHLRFQSDVLRLTSTLIVAVLLVGCGSSTAESNSTQPKSAESNSTQPKSVEEVASQLSEAGLTCSNLRKPPKSEWNLGTQSAIGVGECTVAGEDIEFILFGSSGDMEKYFSAGNKVACEFGKVFGITEFDMVTSGAWTAEGMSKPLAERIAAATGGKAHHITC